jgi:two-component system response regulator
VGIVAIADDTAADLALLKESVPASTAVTGVQTFQSEREVLQYLRSLDGQTKIMPSLYVIDLKMEKADSGHRLLKRIRSMNELAHVPIVICSSSHRHKDIMNSYREGANSFVSKDNGTKSMRKQFAQMFSYWTEVSELP